jgi:hypothetical protein
MVFRYERTVLQPTIDTPLACSAGRLGPCLRSTPLKTSTLSNSGSIRIHRVPGPRDSLRDYSIILDGEQVSKVSENQTTLISVPAGVHELRLKIDWMSSRILRVRIEPNQDMECFCEPGGTNGSGILDMLFHRSKYIHLVASRADLALLPSFEAEYTKRLIRWLAVTAIILLVITPLLIVVGVSPGVGAGVVTLTVMAAFLVLFFGPTRRSGRRRSTKDPDH